MHNTTNTQIKITKQKKTNKKSFLISIIIYLKN